jgi:C_GCAxxG_C_C family probable redox protein
MDENEKNANLVEEAVSQLGQKFNCAQAICSTFGPTLGLPRSTALAMSCALGAGVAYESEVCGAVSGALLMIGLKFGGALESDLKEKAEVMNRAKDFVARFKSANGSIVCRQLLGSDLRTAEGLKCARDEGLFLKMCPGLVRSSAATLAEILQHEK